MLYPDLVIIIVSLLLENSIYQGTYEKRRGEEVDLYSLQQIIITSFLRDPLTSANLYVICPLFSKHVVTGCVQSLHWGFVLFNEDLAQIPCGTW